MRNPIIVALDVPDAGEALRLVEQVAPAVGAFKIGRSYSRARDRTLSAACAR